MILIGQRAFLSRASACESATEYTRGGSICLYTFSDYTQPLRDGAAMSRARECNATGVATPGRAASYVSAAVVSDGTRIAYTNQLRTRRATLSSRDRAVTRRDSWPRATTMIFSRAADGPLVCGRRHIARGRVHSRLASPDNLHGWHVFFPRECPSALRVRCDRARRVVIPGDGILVVLLAPGASSTTFCAGSRFSQCARRSKATLERRTGGCVVEFELSSRGRPRSFALAAVSTA